MYARRLLVAAVTLTVTASALLAGPVASAAATTLTPVYVAMGDSYSSGEGACKPVTVTACGYLKGTATAADECHRSLNAYPARVAATLPKAWKFVFAACSGATTSDAMTSGQYGEQPQLAALAAAAGPTRVVKLVTLTLGGNDAGFSDAVGSCVAAHDFFGSSCRGKVTWAISTAVLRARLTAVYAAVHAAAPQARLLVLGYPRLFTPAPVAKAPCDLAATDARAFSKAEDTLNASVAAAVSRADKAAGAKFATFVDDGSVFKGHELCAGPAAKSYLNPLLLTSAGVRSESFHPNRSGQSVLAAKLRKSLQ
jgi:lysophospholipase L1-like esterase